MDPATESDITAVLVEEGFDVVSVRMVSADVQNEKRVFRTAVVPPDGTDTVRLYAKTFPGHLEDNVVRALEVGSDAGHPEGRILTGQPLVLLMEAVPGRPLSTELPLRLLPGVWRTSRSALRDAARRLGGYLGTLHDRTETGSGGTVPEFLDLRETTRVRFDDRTLAHLDRIFTDLSVASLRRSVVHSDPSPHNVYYHDGDVHLIDFGYRAGPCLSDYALAELGIELMARRLPYVRRNQRDVLLSALRRGYGQTGPSQPDQEPLVTILKAGYCLKLLDRYEAEPKTLRARLTRITDVEILETMVRDVVSVRRGD